MFISANLAFISVMLMIFLLCLMVREIPFIFSPYQLNTLHPALSYNIEDESDSSLPFLQVFVNSGLITSIY